MEHKKYPSIINSYREEFIEKIKDEGLDKLKYVVQEKVHGANFSFITDGVIVKCGKRSDLLPEENTFFNSQKVQDSHKIKILNIYRDLKELYNFDTLTIFGELAGGFYPHEDIDHKLNEGKVQKGVWYSPKIFFYGFDICLDNYFLNVNEVDKIFNHYDIFYAQPLFVGNLEECLNFPIEFNSKIPQWLNLPSIENNICEGIIIRPNETKYFYNGKRVIIKKKNEKFLEKKSIKKSKGLQKQQLNISEECNHLKQVIAAYINENRLNNVISKIGEVTKKDFGLIMKNYNLDILEDFLLDNSGGFIKLVEKEKKYLKKYMGNEATKIIKQYFNKEK
jgi:Rnl2 family RNA ligase